MGLSSALYTTLTGLNANQQQISVVGNNIANVNTVGYKTSSLSFQSLFSQTLSNGQAPSGDNGGTNPVQIGMGAQTGAMTRNFTDGSRQTTGVGTNLAISGDGFFVVQGNQQYFTRDGSFNLSSNNELVNANGLRVQGYSVDNSFNLVPGILSNLTIPLGSLSVAQATTKVTVSGSLSASGVLATQTSQLGMDQPIFQNGSLLTGLTSDAAATTHYFQVGDVVQLGGTRGPVPAAAGTVQIAPKSLTVTATTTVNDFLNFMSGTLGIDTAAGGNGVASNGGTALSATVPATFPVGSSQLQVVGNLGTANDLTLAATDLSITRAGSTLHPFTFTKNAYANGESATAPRQTVYDSLGTPLSVYTTAVLTGRSNNGSTWQYYVTSPDTTTGSTTGGVGTNTFVGSSTLSFDTSGNLLSPRSSIMVLDRSNSGAASSLNFTVAFDNINALTGTDSSLSSLADGAAQGVLSGYAINADGMIDGTFSNGQRKTLGQVALATFANNQGLVDQGNNQFSAGSSSGNPAFVTPGAGNAGTVISNSVELSNVDLSKEFVNMISASTGFSASSRVITTANQLLQELLQSGR